MKRQLVCFSVDYKKGRTSYCAQFILLHEDQFDRVKAAVRAHKTGQGYEIVSIKRHTLAVPEAASADEILSQSDHSKGWPSLVEMRQNALWRAAKRSAGQKAEWRQIHTC